MSRVRTFTIIADHGSLKWRITQTDLSSEFTSADLEELKARIRQNNYALLDHKTTTFFGGLSMPLALKLLEALIPRPPVSSALEAAHSDSCSWRNK